MKTILILATATTVLILSCQNSVRTENNLKSDRTMNIEFTDDNGRKISKAELGAVGKLVTKRHWLRNEPIHQNRMGGNVPYS